MLWIVCWHWMKLLRLIIHWKFEKKSSLAQICDDRSSMLWWWTYLGSSMVKLYIFWQNSYICLALELNGCIGKLGGMTTRWVVSNGRGTTDEVTIQAQVLYLCYISGNCDDPCSDSSWSCAGLVCGNYWEILEHVFYYFEVCKMTDYQVFVGLVYRDTCNC